MEVMFASCEQKVNFLLTCGHQGGHQGGQRGGHLGVTWGSLAIKIPKISKHIIADILNWDLLGQALKLSVCLIIMGPRSRCGCSTCFARQHLLPKCRSNRSTKKQQIVKEAVQCQRSNQLPGSMQGSSSRWVQVVVVGGSAGRSVGRWVGRSLPS